MDSLLAGRYERRHSLGWGAMGEVWLAYDQMLRRLVAVKVLRRGPEMDPHSVERMMREARLAAHLQHPRVVAVYDLLVVDESPVVIMEYVDGESLATRLTREQRIPVEETARIARDVALALAAAHSANIIHRDVKPANIMIDRSGRAKLTDFGIARGVEDPGLTGTGQMIGTVAYMAPEIALGEDPSPAADMYSLGSTMYAAVEGRAPFHTDGARQNTATMLLRMIRENPPAPVYAGPLEPLLARLLNRDPVHRPDAHQVLSALAPLTRAAAVDGPAVTPEAPPVAPSVEVPAVVPESPPESDATPGGPEEHHAPEFVATVQRSDLFKPAPTPAPAVPIPPAASNPLQDPTPDLVPEVAPDVATELSGKFTPDLAARSQTTDTTVGTPVGTTVESEPGAGTSSNDGDGSAAAAVEGAQVAVAASGPTPGSTPHPDAEPESEPEPEFVATVTRPNAARDPYGQDTRLAPDGLALAETQQRSRLPQDHDHDPTTAAPVVKAPPASPPQAARERRASRRTLGLLAIAAGAAVLLLLTSLLSRGGAAERPVMTGKIAITGVQEIRSLTVQPTSTGLDFAIVLGALPTDAEVWVDLKYADASPCPDRAVVFAPAKKAAYVASVECQGNTQVSKYDVTLTDQLDPAVLLSASIRWDDLKMPENASLKARAHIVRDGQSTIWLPPREEYAPLSTAAPQHFALAAATSTPTPTPNPSPPPPLPTLASGSAVINDARGDGKGHADITQVRVTSSGSTVEIWVDLAAPNEDSLVWLAFQDAATSSSERCPQRLVVFYGGGASADMGTAACTGDNLQATWTGALKADGTPATRHTTFTTGDWALPAGTRLKVRANSWHPDSRTADSVNSDLYVTLM